MKKIVLSALLLALTAATSAFAHAEPQMFRIYACDYANYSGPAMDPGLSWWEKRPGSTTEILYTFEHFQLPNGNWENYKATWAKPVTGPLGFTTWEFTFLGGPQCKQTVVSPGGYTISFSQCTDGSTRYCYVP